jgi:hypothetical protein
MTGFEAYFTVYNLHRFALCLAQDDLSLPTVPDICLLFEKWQYLWVGTALRIPGSTRLPMTTPVLSKPSCVVYIIASPNRRQVIVGTESRFASVNGDVLRRQLLETKAMSAGSRYSASFCW